MQIKKSIMKKVAVSVQQIAKMSAGRRCIASWHQPKVPASLRKENKPASSK